MITDKSDKTYLTYWNPNKKEPFDMSRIFTDLKYELNGKPTAAFWGSPEDAEYGWKEWCHDNDFYIGKGGYDFNNPIKWKLEKDSKILQIGRKNEIELVPNNPLIKYVNIVKDYTDRTVYKNLTVDEKLKTIYNGGSIEIDYERMKEDGIVAVELLDACIGHLFINRLELCFNGWDCESICVLDPRKIIWL